MKESRVPAPRPRPRIDVPVAVRGASTGFSILIIGGLMSPIIAAFSPPLAGTWLTAVAIAAFAISARRVGLASVPVLHGAFAAVASYVLVLPLLLPFEAGRNLPQILFTFATAISVGACTSWIQARRGESAEPAESGPSRVVADEAVRPGPRRRSR
jgi:hypothetical protein